MLSNECFKENMAKMAAAFNARWDSNRAEIYYDRLCHIPSECFEWIALRWIDRGGKFPLISNLLELWFIWKEHHRDRMVKGIEHSECKECGSTGYLYGIEEANGYPYEFMFYCAKCKNARSRDKRLDSFRKTKEEVIALGYQISDGDGNVVCAGG